MSIKITIFIINVTCSNLMLPSKTNLFFVFDSEKDEFIGSDPDYHFTASNRFMSYGKRVPEVKRFLLDFYTKWKPENKTVIVNKSD